MEGPLSPDLVLLDAEQGRSAGMEAVVVELVLDPEPNEQGARQADGQAGDVDEGVALLPFHLAPGGLEIARAEGGDETGRAPGAAPVEGMGPVLAVFGGDRLGRP